MSDSKEDATITKAALHAAVKQEMDNLMNSGYTDKEKIYKKIMEKFKLERQTVRSIAREFRREMCEKIKVLQSGICLNES